MENKKLFLSNDALYDLIGTHAPTPDLGHPKVIQQASSTPTPGWVAPAAWLLIQVLKLSGVKPEQTE